MFSMKKLSNRRLAVLAFIHERVARQGQPPTLAEIAEACGLVSRSAARKHVVALEEAGLIEVAPGQARGARPSRARTRTDLIREISLFEITPRDVADLDDSALRELLARLCNASLAASRHPSQYVTWGGDQRASDGGVDVRLDAPQAVAGTAGFPRPVIGYQVKKMRMPRSEIQGEMCPGGVLRPSIRNIVKAGGAYIIVSSESTSDSSYQERKKAMQEAVAGVEGADVALVDFYDARRIADWTNRHPGVVTWVRERLGKPLQGWRPHGQWVVNRGSKAHPFVDDESPRLVDPADREQHRYSLQEGLQYVRTLLRRGGASVRIAGLSGVGKTRFAQALFEGEAVESAIDPSLAVYCDVSDEPMPAPQVLLDELVAAGRRVVLVVDNCSSELHAKLVAKCKGSDAVSLLTIEYDIREDTPNETSVFRLDPASSELITEVIKQQFPYISQVDAATITRFSEGNSRVAIALADTVGKGESLGRLSDDALFNRLFWQKHDKNDSLLRAARACALVYSFDGENEANELPRLAVLADMGVLGLHGEVATLLQRGLAQKRGPWRAVLPHAIATRLAKLALSAIPYSFIATQLVEGRGRLLRSFSRRLGYLHDSEEAIAIVRGWLAEGGLLGDVAGLSEPLVEVLRNVAPVDRKAALESIERAANGDDAEQFLAVDNPARSTITHLLRSIAYEAEHFDRCLAVLVLFALAEPPGNRMDRTDELIKSMFTIYLSGTHATRDQRASWIRAHLESADERVQGLAIRCLDSALETNHFSSHYGFDFGAWSRNYGYTPKRGPEALAWFESFIALAVEFGMRESALGARVRNMLASNFRSMWTNVRRYDQLEDAVARLMPLGWEKGWLAIRQTMRFDKDDKNPEGARRLAALEQRIRPRTLAAQTKAVVLTSFSAGLDITDGDEYDGLKPYERAERYAEDLGRAVATDAESLEVLLPMLVENKQARQSRFGFGLAKGSNQPEQLWRALVSAFESTDADIRGVQVLLGFLSGLHEVDRPLFERLLDEALDSPTLSEWVPVLQTCAPLDERGSERLMRSLERGAAPADKYQYLAYGRVTEGLADPDMARLIRGIADKDDGLLVALDVMAMHLHGKPQAGPEITAAARELVPKVPLTVRRNHQLDFSLKSLVEKCMAGPDGEPAARALLLSLRAGMVDHTLSSYDFEDVIGALFSVHPVAALDELVDPSEDDPRGFIRTLTLEGLHGGQHPLANVPLETLLAWCRGGDSERWALLADSIPAFAEDDDKHVVWTEAALELIRHSPEQIKVIRALARRVKPMSWSGSRAAIMSKRLPLFDALEAFLQGEDLAALRQYREDFERQIERERAWEQQERDPRDNSFE